uniref:Uncharacterized protein n=1 Tax=Oryza punctata TaxID=4537 RepID=A0A0E0M648_ORYPU
MTSCRRRPTSPSPSQAQAQPLEDDDLLSEILLRLPPKPSSLLGFFKKENKWTYVLTLKMGWRSDDSSEPAKGVGGTVTKVVVAGATQSSYHRHLPCQAELRFFLRRSSLLPHSLCLPLLSPDVKQKGAHVVVGVTIPWLLEP